MSKAYDLIQIKEGLIDSVTEKKEISAEKKMETIFALRPTN